MIYGLILQLTVRSPSVGLCQSGCAGRNTPLTDSVLAACKLQAHHHHHHCSRQSKTI